MTGQAVRIVRLQVDELDPGPLPVPFQDSTMGPFTHWKLTWLRVTADDGTVGQSPGALPDLIVDALLREGPQTPAQWWQRCWWMLRNNGHRSPATSGPLFALDMALRDILARRAGLPWHRYMGARRDAVPVYGSGGSTHLTEDQLLAEMNNLAACGYKTVKMKVGKDFGTRMDEDARRVRAVRDILGEGVGLAIDANQVWSAEQALDFARRVAGLNIAWFEEPVHSADRVALRQLCRECPMPVAMGESENHWLGFRDLAECGVGHLQPSPHGLPGFEPWSDALAFATAAGPLWSAGGFSHLTAMYVATRADGLVEYLRSIIGHLATCWKRLPRIDAGLIHLPDIPGLPVEVDWDALAQRQAIRPLLDKRA